MSFLGKFETSGYGLSALDLNKSLYSRALMQAEMQTLYSKTTKVEVDSSETNAEQAKQGLLAQAKGMIQQGWAGIAGAAAGFAATIGSSVMEGINIRKAGMMNTPKTSDEVELQEIKPALPAASAAAQGTGVVTGQLPAANPAAAAPAASTSAAPAKTAMTPEERKIAEYNANQQWWQQHGSNFASFMNQLGNSTGNLLSARQTKLQADAKLAEAIAQMEATVMKSVTDNQSTAINGMNQFNDNTEGTITAIIRASHPS